MSVEVRLGTVLRYRGYQKDCLGVLNSVSPDLLGPGVCGLTDYINKYSKKVLAFPSGTAGPIIEVTDDVWTAQQLYLALIQGGLREDIARIHSNFLYFHTRCL